MTLLLLFNSAGGAETTLRQRFNTQRLEPQQEITVVHELGYQTEVHGT